MKMTISLPPSFRDLRFWLTFAAVALGGLAAALPPLPFNRPTFNLLAVVDITSSMNTRDYQKNGRPVSRLETMKDALREMLTALPCQSKLGLAIFTERRPFLLFEPVEVCGNFETLDREIAALDWRMAWEGDSHIASGLFRSVDLADDLGADLIFMSDGQEAPPLPWTGGPHFDGAPSRMRGLIVGTGGYDLSPIPKFDEFGHETGFWRPEDIPNENVNAPPPPGAEEREGYNPRNAPFGGRGAEGHEYLSAVDEKHLKELAAETGLGYAHFESFAGFMAELKAAATPRTSRVMADMSWIPAVLCLAALIILYGALPAWDRRMAGFPLLGGKKGRGRIGAVQAKRAPLRRAKAAAKLFAFLIALAAGSRHVQAEADELRARGAYLAMVTGCVGCHSPRTDDGELFADRLLTGGNHPIAVGPLGRIYPPNITQDMETGIGAWSVDDMVNCLTHGATRNGRILSSAMHWRSQFSKLENEDARAIALYLKSVPPAANRVPPAILLTNAPSSKPAN